ncbi:DEAD/DEAH box helicase [Pigmentiphaga litoralis]|uniref:ligase-associated DNA damage response DEXH box helicase n=1 Tax=Pigmentiphaga litoralis TaxID=516702 RepID=UPI003B434D71
MAARGWSPFRFQQDAWDAIIGGKSGLLHATTGAGKTYAIWLGALLAFGARAVHPPMLDATGEAVADAAADQGNGAVIDADGSSPDASAPRKPPRATHFDAVAGMDDDEVENEDAAASGNGGRRHVDHDPADEDGDEAPEGHGRCASPSLSGGLPEPRRVPRDRRRGSQATRRRALDAALGLSAPNPAFERGTLESQGSGGRPATAPGSPTASGPATSSSSATAQGTPAVSGPGSYAAWAQAKAEKAAAEAAARAAAEAAGKAPGKAGIPAGSQSGSSAGSRAGSPAGSQSGSPAGGRAGSSAGSKAGTQAGSQADGHADSRAAAKSKNPAADPRSASDNAALIPTREPRSIDDLETQAAVNPGAIMRAASSAMRRAIAASRAAHAAASAPSTSVAAPPPPARLRSRAFPPPPLTVVWLTPMRALAADTYKALNTPVDALGLDWTVGQRTGDTGSSDRAAQARRLPTALITTPESLSLMLARNDAEATLSTIRMVVVDEWHELLGNKRGVQVQLALARLRRWNPQLQVWGLSATLGNLDEAMQTLLGANGSGNANAARNAVNDVDSSGSRGTGNSSTDTRSTSTAASTHTAIIQPDPRGVLVRGQEPKTLLIDTLLPDEVERFAWAGHLGLRMLPKVIGEIASSSNTLVFTNTRSQAELWYQALLDAKPEWAGEIALHHGSLDKAVRDWVEEGLKTGSLRAVVCTSSLDLGVDFLPVDRVLQIGSAKGVARLLQRAGRSGHAPGRPSRVTLVPTHSIEVIEGAAAREAVREGHVEARTAPDQPLDVLVQHLVTVALGGGFTPDRLYDEVRTAWSYRSLSRESWQWCLDFVRQGGESLAAYPDYRRVVPDAEGVWRVPDARLARRHRMSVGTIVSDASMQVRYWTGKGGGGRLGTIEESFIARLKPGEGFLFAGKVLELVRVHEMTAFVKRASARKPAVPRWNGGKMPMSSTLADAVVDQLEAASKGHYDSPELRLAKPLLDIQQRWSALPTAHSLLAETLKSREGWHLFLYPFAGRHVHLGIASLLAWRAAQLQPATFSMAVNDYGLELLSSTPVDWVNALPRILETRLPAGVAPPELPDDLLKEILDSMNAGELAQRRFREIARVSGLIFQGFPGAAKSMRQVQASSGLFYDVFRKYDPGNLLLTQAEREVLSQELDIARLQHTLERLRERELDLRVLERPTPFGFPLLVERFREKLSNESLADRVARMVQNLEQVADATVKPRRAAS